MGKTHACSDPKHHVHDAAGFVAAVERACNERGLRLTAIRARVLSLVAAGRASSSRTEKARGVAVSADSTRSVSSRSRSGKTDHRIGVRSPPVLTRAVSTGVSLSPVVGARATRTRMPWASTTTWTNVPRAAVIAYVATVPGAAVWVRTLPASSRVAAGLVEAATDGPWAVRLVDTTTGSTAVISIRRRPRTATVTFRALVSLIPTAHLRRADAGGLSQRGVGHAVTGSQRERGS